MLIDAHAHIGKFVQISMPQDMLVAAMDKYHIDFSLFSNGSGVEVDHDQNPIPPDLQQSQLSINLEAIEFARKHPGRLGVLLWAKPSTENCDERFEKLLNDNLDIIHGIKVHPYHSKVCFSSPKVEAYVKLAQRYGIPVVTHTANDDDSSPQAVYRVALKYPDVNFVMCHMGLATDNLEAIDLISRLPNLYGDTAWVKMENCLTAIDKCGIDKILFGTDNPINGLETYDDDEFYTPYFTKLKTMLTTSEYEQLMYKNAVRLFKLPF